MHIQKVKQVCALISEPDNNSVTGDSARMYYVYTYLSVLFLLDLQ